MVPADSLQYCINLVKEKDYHHYLATLLLPKGCQPAVFAIRAFNVELALVRDKIERNSGTAGIYRLQFWKDAINAIYPDAASKGKKLPLPRQPAAIALKQFASDIDPTLLHKLVEARQGTLGDRPFESVIALEQYAIDTHGVILRLTLEVISKSHPLPDDQRQTCFNASNYVAGAVGLAAHIRATAPLLPRGIVILPADLMAIHSLSQESVFSGKDPAALRSLVKDIALFAEKRLRDARTLRSGVPKSHRNAFLPALIADSYLNRLKSADFDIFSVKLRKPFGLMPLRMLTGRLTGRY